jgi:hypothetical protein
MFRSNVPTLAQLTDRLEVCERQLAERLPVDRLLGAIADLVERFKPSRQTIKVEIEHWPSGFARQLIAAGVKCHSTVREIARMYSELLDDVTKAQELIELLRQSGDEVHEKKTHDILVRLRRQLYYRREDLDNLGVTIREVSAGEPFNAAIHEPLSTVTGDRVLKDTIAEARSPLYTWRDEQGLEQHVPAQVVVFADAAA